MNHPGDGEGGKPAPQAVRAGDIRQPEDPAGPDAGGRLGHEGSGSANRRGEAPASGRSGISPLERRLLTQIQSASGEEMGSLRREVEGLQRLLNVSRDLSSILDHDRLLEAILDSAIFLTSAERGLLLGAEEGRLRVILGRGAQGQSLDPAALRISETLARQCVDENRVIPLDNIATLPELRDVRSIKALDLYAACCVPLRERGGATGVLYVDSSVPGLRTSPREIRLLEAFAAQASVSLLNARLLRNLEDSRVLLTRENLELRAGARSGAGFGVILGRSPAMLALFDKIRLLKDSDIPVLVLGESGTGKELVAKALHYEGLRQSGPFVPVNCAGFPGDMLEGLMFGHRRGAFTGAYDNMPGLVEQAEGGTLFLDEIGDMPLTLQVKLLRFLESGEFRRLGENETRRVKVRVISATNREPLALIREKLFREDLYFRLAGVRLELPPLRTRKEDLLLLIQHFFDQARQQSTRQITGMTERARTFLLRHAWPGNVRQLRNAIEGACALVPDGAAVDELELRMQLPEEGPPQRDLGPGESLLDALVRIEKNAIESALENADGNIAQAARDLRISRQTLHNRIRYFKLQGFPRHRYRRTPADDPATDIQSNM